MQRYLIQKLKKYLRANFVWTILLVVQHSEWVMTCEVFSIFSNLVEMIWEYPQTGDEYKQVSPQAKDERAYSIHSFINIRATQASSIWLTSIKSYSHHTRVFYLCDINEKVDVKVAPNTGKNTRGWIPAMPIEQWQYQFNVPFYNLVHVKEMNERYIYAWPHIKFLDYSISSDDERCLY